MKELRSYSSAYDRKRTAAFYGPYRAPRRERWSSVIFVVLCATLMALVAVLELSK